MTREDILSNYEVRDGHIVSPDKFEGEWLYAPYFYEDSLNGTWDENRDGILYCVPSFEEHKLFPELKGKRFIHLYEDAYGFVHVY